MKSLLIFLFVIAAASAFAVPNPLEEMIEELVSKYQNENDDPTIHNVFEVGKTYLILGNNNKFLSIINYGGTRGVNDYIESIKNQPDVFCRFVASTLYNGKIALRAVERNMYLQLHGVYIQTIAGDLGTAAQLEVEVGDPISETYWPGAHYVYLKADNGKYWGIESNSNKMVATYDTKEIATRLIALSAP